MNNLIYYLSAFVFSVGVNFLFIKFWKFSVLKSHVKQDRWGSKVVPLTGGLSIFLVFSIFSIFKIGAFEDDNKMIVALIGGVFLFLLGLVDDLINLKSYQKFLAQVFVVLMIMSFGIQASYLGKPLCYVITFLWILGITNAFNLLDNIDGLSAGIGAIAFIFLGLNFIGEGALLLSHFSLVLAAILLGFLIFNFNPAKVYLGDSGALVIGYFLSIFTIIGSQKSGKSVFVTVIFPILIMLIPILDTVLVSITRNMRGQSPFEGGKDHLSHRLVTLGMSEKQAVLFLYSISILLGISAFFFVEISTVFSMVIYFFISLVFILFGVYIGKIRIGSPSDRKKSAVVLSSNFLYKKRIFHILVDLILIALVYYLSYLIRFEGTVSQKNITLYLESVPIVILFKIIFLYYFNVYKIESMYFSVRDGLNVIKGLTLGSVSSVLVLTLLNRFLGYSRAVFVVDWMLAIIVLGAVKVFYRLFEELFAPIRYKERGKIVVIGGDSIFQSINKYLQFKPAINLRILKHIVLTDFNFDDMIEYLKKPDHIICMILMEDKTILTSEQLISIQRMGIPVVNEKEFFAKILE